MLCWVQRRTWPTHPVRLPLGRLWGLEAVSLVQHHPVPQGPRGAPIPAVLAAPRIHTTQAHRKAQALRASKQIKLLIICVRVCVCKYVCQIKNECQKSSFLIHQP